MLTSTLSKMSQTLLLDVQSGKNICRRNRQTISFLWSQSAKGRHQILFMNSVWLQCQQMWLVHFGRQWKENCTDGIVWIVSGLLVRSISIRYKQNLLRKIILFIVTSRIRSIGKVMFLHVSVILFVGGEVCQPGGSSSWQEVCPPGGCLPSGRRITMYKTWSIYINKLKPPQETLVSNLQWSGLPIWQETSN